MKSKWIIIPIEIKAREFLGRMLVASIAVERGYSVLIGHDRVVRRLAYWLPRGIIFDKGLGVAKDRKVIRYHRLGYQLTAVDEESTGFYPNPDLSLSLRLSDESLMRAQRWFCLSDKMRDHAVRIFPGHKEKFVTTGLPRTDIWRPEFRSLYEEDARALRIQHGNYLLFCSNFGSIIHARKGAFLEKQYRRSSKSNASLGQYRSQIEKQGAQNLTEFLSLLPKLRQSFPDQKILIRPHPSEDRSFWVDYVSRHSGMEVHTEGAATPWILGSACLIHHGCTTGIEAELLGKPHIMYAPHPDEHHDTPLMKRFAPIAHTEAELMGMMSGILSGKSFAKDRKALEEYYASLVGSLASEKIVDEFDQISTPTQKLQSRLSLLRYTPRNLVARFGPKSDQNRVYSLQKYPGISMAEITRLNQALKQGLGFEGQTGITEVFPQLFQIQKLNRNTKHA